MKALVEQGYSAFVGTGWAQPFNFINEALHTIVLLLFFLSSYPYFPFTKSHKSFRQSMKGFSISGGCGGEEVKYNLRL